MKYRDDKTTLLLIMATWQSWRYQNIISSHTDRIHDSANTLKCEHFL